MRRVSFREAYELRLGIYSMGFIGEYGIANKRPNMSIRAPFSMPSLWACRPGSNKLFLHPDQVFPQGISMECAMDCLEYCMEYDSIPEGTPSLPGPVPPYFKITVECSTTITLLSAVHTLIESGSMEIGLGMKMEKELPLAMRITPESIGGVPNINKTGMGLVGKILTIEGKDLKEIPLLEFITSEPVQAMPDKLVQGVEKTISDLICFSVPFAPRETQMPLQFRLMAPTITVSVRADQILYSQGLRLNPCFPDSKEWDGNLDHHLFLLKRAELTSVLRITSYPDRFKEKPTLIGPLVAKLVARYGTQKLMPQGFQHKIDTTSELATDYEEGQIRKNRARFGRDWTKYYWPDDLPVADPGELATVVWAIRKSMNEIDPTTRLYSPSLPVDRTYIYQFIRHCRVRGQSPFQKICLHLQSIDEIPALHSCIMLLGTYETGTDVVVRVSESIPEWKWPALLYLFVNWNVSQVVFDGYKNLIQGKDPTDAWFGLVDRWYSKVKDRPITKVQFNNRTVRAIHRETNADKRLDCIMPGLLCQEKPVFNGEALEHPQIILTRGMVKHGKRKNDKE
jgi:hypothetical protein